MKRTVLSARKPAPRFVIDRRDALKTLAAGIAALAAGCSRPAEEIVPYVDMPERVVPGKILRFATTVQLGGYGRGAVAITHEGRPTKLEGNPRHPASLGSSDIFLEAMVLDLYDPDRQQSVRSRALPIAGWADFGEALAKAMQTVARKNGAGLHILTDRVTSPTLIRQMQSLMAKFPAMAWHRFEPVNDDCAIEGAQLAFGQKLITRADLAKADVIWAIGADFLGPGPEQPRLARAFSSRRVALGRVAKLSRLYVTESAWSLTGANADHRLAMAPDALWNFSLAVSAHCGVGAGATLNPAEEKWASAIASDLLAQSEGAIVLVGADQPPELHALAHALNHRVAAPITYIAPLEPVSETHAKSLATLAQALEAGEVEILLMLGTNPVYDSDLPFARLIPRARLSAHLSRYDDETSEACDWALPQTHPLEDWSDLRAPDGTASIVQPLIAPLFDTRNAHQLVAMLLGDATKPHDIVRQTWSSGSGASGDDWRDVLEAGVIAGTASATVSPPAPRVPVLKPREARAGYTLVVLPDPSIYDGRFANNAWLQECPKPLTFEVWGNAFEVSSADAKALGLEDGDGLCVTSGSQTIEGPVRIRDGIAPRVIATTYGYGRTRAGAVGNDIGFRVVSLAHRSVEVKRAGQSRPVYQAHRMGEVQGEPLQIYPELDLATLARTDHLQSLQEPPSLVSLDETSDGYSWGMVIDTSACIGCNACVISCQAENNIGTVGPGQIAMGREMHWMRIDAFGTGHRKGFQPVPCMHCEKAPCEPVCPVEASIHDHEGLNVQVYNRCIGTRFCEANCPYKVRRFNWFGYTDGQEYADLGSGLMAAHYNPDVTVRARGVMEKCTYCVQRITRARRHAEEEKRRIGSHEVVTACQAACPTRAIHFGNLADPTSHVDAMRKDPRHYTLLRELGTRPRTTYLARLVNPNPKLKGVEA
jgi:molybdopterin-containing oxidoreductase family iron-sulfur binding subunit